TIQLPVARRLGQQSLHAQTLHTPLGERVLIDDLSFTLPHNGIVGVIGPYGVGKTTLFKTIVGFEPLDSGELKVGDAVVTSYVSQSRGGIDPEKSLVQVASAGPDYSAVVTQAVPARAYDSDCGRKLA
ncbi:ATP-binding cassette domain-containing protein, partial [Clavibacter michiganensis]|uniref:ATP-binding cassette domain-containing protein n=1 Tax=Clavibacter michiganensis TaxID=28447 RepID=UPI00292DF0C8